MGQDKLLLPWPGGGRVVDRPAAALRAVCGELVSVGRAPGADLGLNGFRPLADVEAHQGPLAGILAALEEAATPWVLVLAGDMPDVTPQLLAALQREAERDPARALIPAGPVGPEPLAAAYPAALAPVVRERFRSGIRAARAALPLDLQRAWPYEEVRAVARLDPPFCSLNDPEDWKARRALPAVRRPRG